MAATTTRVARLLADSFTVPRYFVVVMSKSAPSPASFSVKRSYPRLMMSMPVTREAGGCQGRDQVAETAAEVRNVDVGALELRGT